MEADSDTTSFVSAPARGASISSFPELSPRVCLEAAAAISIIISGFIFFAYVVQFWAGHEGTETTYYLGVLFASLGSLSVVLFVTILWKNLNMALLKQLFTEVNVLLVVLLLGINMFIDISTGLTEFSLVFSLMLTVTVMGSIMLNAVESISRPFSIFITSFVVVCILFNTASYYTSNPCETNSDKVASITNNRLTKIEAKRLIFVEMIVLLTSAVYIGVRDQQQKYIAFPIGVVVKTSYFRRLNSRSHRAISLSSWCFTGNHLAECVAIIAGIIAFALFFAYDNQIWSAVLAIVSVLTSILFVVKGNIDPSVLRLVFAQFPVIVILVCCVLGVVWDLVMLDTYGGYFVFSDFSFLLIVTLNITLDAVRIVSRLFLLCVCFSTIVSSANLLVFSMRQLQSCTFPDEIHQHNHNNSRITAVELKRLIAFIIVCSHIRPWYLLLFNNKENHTLRFVVTKVKKHLVYRESEPFAVSASSSMVLGSGMETPARSTPTFTTTMLGDEDGTNRMVGNNKTTKANSSSNNISNNNISNQKGSTKGKHGRVSLDLSVTFDEEHKGSVVRPAM